jgi:hypothetical protein
MERKSPLAGIIQTVFRTTVITATFLFVAPGINLWALGNGNASSMCMNPLYADIEKVNDQYVITKVGNQPLLFRLNDLEPQFDTKSYVCTQYGGIFAMEVTHPEMCRDDKRTFRKVQIDLRKTFADDFLTIGRRILTGEFEEYSGFDRDAYRGAIEEALTNSGLDKEKLLKAFEQCLASGREMKVRSRTEYGRMKEDLASQFSIAVEDQSGLYRNDLSASDLVHLRENDLPDIEKNPLRFSTIENDSIEKALHEVKGKYASELERLSSFYILETLNSARHYNLRVEAPDRIFLKDGSRQTIPLKVVVLSKNIMEVAPVYRNEDVDLRMEDDGQTIQLDTLISYYGKSATESRLDMDLAPGSLLSLDRRDGRLHLPPRENYFNATRDSLKGKELSFGYGIRYRVIGRQAKQSLQLQKVETHPVYDLLNRDS